MNAVWTKGAVVGKVDPNGRKVRLPDEADGMLVAKATEVGMSPGEYLRELVMVHLYGVDELARMHRSRLLSLAQPGVSAGTVKTR